MKVNTTSLVIFGSESAHSVNADSDQLCLLGYNTRDILTHCRRTRHTDVVVSTDKQHNLERLRSSEK